MKVRFLLIIIVLSGALSGWAEDIPGKKCKQRDDCDNFELQHCVLGHCLWNGTGIDKYGCCYGEHRLVADFVGLDNNQWIIADIDCGKWGEQCGWDVKDGGYMCVKAIDNQTTFYEDPSGKHPRECDFTCHPRCEGKECGPDWCGGSCGECPAGQVCTKDGKCCTPQCDGKECGPDGCGGTCGECQKGQKCVMNQCIWPKGSIIGPSGCCYKNHSISLNMVGGVFVKDCGKEGKTCGWESKNNGYRCVDRIDNKTTFMEDPSGEHPRECDFDTCIPQCQRKACGDDSCGGSCGSCKEGEECIHPEASDAWCCKRQCDGKECGPDGCGDVCGICKGLKVCEDGKCVYDYGCKPHPLKMGCPNCACEKCVCDQFPQCCTVQWSAVCADVCKYRCGGCHPCKPDCDGKECGDDGCHGKCGYCPKGMYCSNYHCKPCSCDGRECGKNQCGEDCGKCPAGQECTKDGKCCTPQCDGKECGSDGCGGSCGTCQVGFRCNHGKCVKCDGNICKENGYMCGKDACGNVCGMCDGGVCVYHMCYYCAGYCDGYECGDDGCGGSCGHCGPCEECISHHCKPIPDCEVPPEPVPDTAEDIHVEKDAVEVVDSGNTGKDVKKDEHGNGNDRDEKKSGDSIKDVKGIDNGGAPPMRPSGGGCATGKGAGSGILLILMGVLGLFLLRKRKKDVE